MSPSGRMSEGSADKRRGGEADGWPRVEAPLAPGSRVGPYLVGPLIGAGGMGRVYRARDDRLGRDVALKVLPAEFMVDSVLHEPR